MKIQESAENYLETILVLSQKQPFVRSIDVATELGFSKASVSVAMKNLKENGYVQTDASGHLSLTETGLEIAEMIYERHTLISDWLTKLGVSRETASEDACRMEHVISAESFQAIKNHIRKAADPDTEKIQEVIERVDDADQKHIDWTAVWAVKYPVLASYQKEVRTADYETALAALLKQLQSDYGYSSLDACLVLKDILGHMWSPDRNS